MFKEIHFHTISSTHLYALDHIREFEGQFVFISAKKQTCGVGLKGDPWISEGDNLLGTFVFPLPTNDSSNIAQLLAFSAIKVLEKLALAPLFKWPNDILLSYKKVAGVMCAIKDGTALVSIGLNINMGKLDLEKINKPATSLSEELRGHLSVEIIKNDLLSQFFNDLSLFQTKGFDPFFLPFRQKLAFIGKLAHSGIIQGRIEALNRDGRLILNSSGTKHLISTSSLEIIE
jgi:BirA family transcriptional regulator, biotin operon repressor / biotin---[acetyl-CoA-carboxylase] ligase